MPTGKWCCVNTGGCHLFRPVPIFYSTFAQRDFSFIMTIIPLSEGAFTIDATKEFVPFNKETDDLQQRTTGSLLVEIQPFVVVTSKDIILLDTGLGFVDGTGVLQIHQHLQANGIDPMNVTKVLLTHLHKDHAGGIVQHQKGSHQATLSFPKATYYVHKEELSYALAQPSLSYVPDVVRALQHAPNVQLIEGNGQIDEHISYECTSAHSRYHQVFWIKADNQILFFGGDDAPQLQQMKNRFVAKYDFDGKKTMQLRQDWREKGTAENWTFLFYHDIKTPTYTF